MTPSLMNEKVLVQKDGITSKLIISAIFSRNTILVEDIGIEIVSGDIIVRVKEDHVERYFVATSEHKSMDDTIPVYLLTVELISDLQEEIDEMIS